MSLLNTKGTNNVSEADGAIGTVWETNDTSGYTEDLSFELEILMMPTESIASEDQSGAAHINTPLGSGKDTQSNQPTSHGGDIPTIDLESGTATPATNKETSSTQPLTVKEPESPKATLDFPAPFYCPFTRQLMEDPVVAPDGVSYERHAILEKYDPNQLYPNRALNQIVEEALLVAGDSMDASIRRFQKSLKQGIDQLLEKSVLPSDEFRPLPDAFYCPITFELMHVPMIDPEGNTFEHVAIANWIHVNSSSPITRNKLSMDDLVPNKAISDLLELEKSKPDNLMHPTVRKFKNETAPVMPDFPDPETGGSNFPSRPLPTTLEELEYRREAKRKTAYYSIVGFICLILAILATIFYGGSCIFTSVWLSCCLRDSLHQVWRLHVEEGALVEQLAQEEETAQEERETPLEEEEEAPTEERAEEGAPNSADAAAPPAPATSLEVPTIESTMDSNGTDMVDAMGQTQSSQAVVR